MTQPIKPPYPQNIPLLKGALVSIDPSSNQRNTVAFQYNPAKVKRTLTANTIGGRRGDRSESVSFVAAPSQSLDLEVQIEAVEGGASTTAGGVYPQLSALELLVYPSAQNVTQAQSLLGKGALEIVPPKAPRVIFIWGSRRVLPVRVTKLGVRETLFDPQLNPIAATVDLSLTVLTYSDLYPDNPDYQLFLAYQQNLQKLAQSSGYAANADSTTGVDVSNL